MMGLAKPVTGPLKNMAIFGIHVRFLGCIFQNHFFFEATPTSSSPLQNPPPSFQIPVPCGLTGFHPGAMILEYMKVKKKKTSSWKMLEVSFPKEVGVK